VIVFWSYSYSLLVLMFNLPSWMLMVPLGEILGYFSYVLVLAFLDTLLILALMLGVTFLLPRAWFRDDFVASGSMTAGLLFFWITIVQLAFGFLMTLPVVQFLVFILAAFISLAVAVVIVRRMPAVRKFVLWLASSTSIFIYLYGFLTAVSVVVVLIRNLF